MNMKLNGINYETIKLSCGIVEEYFDVIDVMEESKGRITKADRLAMKEFLCLMFNSKFTVDDINTYLEFPDLLAYFKLIGDEITKKTNSKFEKLAKK